jgi:hypothetical protein
MMSESSEAVQTGVVSANACAPKDETTEKMCHGLWRLKPGVLLRVEDDGAILFNPDTDSLSVVNPTGCALLQWRHDRICYEEWCTALCQHYHARVDQVQVEADVKKFLGAIAPFAEPCDGNAN